MTTDQQVLTEIQYALLEVTDGGVTWSDLWTASEVTNLLTQRQWRFLKDTGVVLNLATINTPANERVYPLPDDWVATRRLSWQNPSGVYTPLARGSSWELEHADATNDINAAATPQVWSDAEAPGALQLLLGPAAVDNGVLQALYVALAPTLTGSGVSLVVPDDCVPFIKWGTIADLLGKIGRGHDQARAAYAEMRYQLGVDLIRHLLSGGWA